MDGRPTILVVDDHAANLVALEAVLAPLGHRVVLARSGLEAIAVAGDVDVELALVLLDVMMPGMDGLETAVRLREMPRSRRTPVIFVTAADHDEKMVHAAYGLGAVDFIPKPLDPMVLRGKVAVFVELFEQRRELVRQQRALHEQSLASARAEAAQRAAETSSRAKDEFLAMVSHELRTPLNAILGWAELLRDHHLDAARSCHAVEVIARSARTQAQLIEDLLDLSRFVAGRVELEKRSVKLGLILGAAIEVVRPLAERAGIEIVAVVSDAEAEVMGDPHRLQQVIWNLLSNSIKFSERGSSVNVTVESDGERVIVRVQDRGKGIAREFLPHVFERFAQADTNGSGRHSGLGLGLAIVEHIVRAHEGSITAHSDGQGRGATFEVTLPSAPLQRESTHLEPDGHSSRTTLPFHHCRRPGPPRLDGVRVLVVDDEADSREVLRTLLERAGAQVWVAASALEALALLERDRCHLVLSDLSMPHMDGYSLAHEIRKRWPSLPMVAVTALGSAEDRTRAMAAGFVSHVAKPYSASQMLGLVAMLALPAQAIAESQY